MLLLLLRHLDDRLPAIREDSIVLSEYVGRRKWPGEETQFLADRLMNFPNN